MGSIYKRGEVYWIKYYRNGKSYRESSGSTKKMVAKKLLDRKEGEIAQGKVPSIVFEKVTFDELAREFITDYRINGKKSLDRAEQSVKYLSAEFEGVRIPQLTTPRIQDYVADRMKWSCKPCGKKFHYNGESHCPYCGKEPINPGAANATINRELSALRRILNLGARQTPPKVNRVPYIPMLKENNARKGFFEHDEFLSFLEALPPFLKGFVTFGYKSGWRISEISGLTWAQVDRQEGIVRLDIGETKNDEARTLYLDEELKSVIDEQWKKRKGHAKILQYVFTNRTGDDRIKRFDKAWRTACKNSRIGIRVFHDLRRTAVRNMVRSGIPERVAMEISGHKTRSVFDRYNITNGADLKAAALKQEAYLNSRVGTISGTITDFPVKSGSGIDT